MAGFLAKYALVSVTLKPGAGGKSTEERCRTKMLTMIKLQKSGKAKRTWFRQDGAEIVFVPRYANVPVATALGRGRGKGARNAWAIRGTPRATLRDFQTAVAKGEFDSALVEIAEERSRALSKRVAVRKARKSRKAKAKPRKARAKPRKAKAKPRKARTAKPASGPASPETSSSTPP